MESHDAPASPEEAYTMLQEWYALQTQLAELKAKEIDLRRLMVSYYYPAPTVGTNRMDLGGGYDLKLDFGYDYKVDEAALDGVTKTDIKKHKLPMDELVVFKPVLSVKVFNSLTDDQREFVEEAFLEKKEKSPQLKIVPAKGADAPEVAFDEPTPAPRKRKATSRRKPTNPPRTR